MTPDFINASFEFGGGFVIWGNVARLYHDKLVRGVHWTYMTFFTAWGVWNLYFYPYLEQWWSFTGGVSLVIASIVWISQMFYYNWREHAGYSWMWPRTLDGKPYIAGSWIRRGPTER